MAGRDARHRWFDTLLNIVFTFPPRLLIAASAAIEIKEATSAYSIAVAPRMQRRIFVNPLIAHSLVNQRHSATADVTAPSSHEAAKCLRGMVNARRMTGRHEAEW